VMNILLLSQFGEWHEPSYFRFYQYFKFLNVKKVKVSYKSLINHPISDYFIYDKIKSRNNIFPNLKRIFELEFNSNYDLLWVDSEALPNIPFVLESFFLPINKKVILDLGDSTHYKYEKSNKKYYKYFMKDKISGLIQRADSVISRNSTIKEYVDQYKKENSHLLLSGIDTKLYQPVSYVQDYSNTETVIGFIGTFFSSHYLIKISDVLKEISRVYPIRLVILNGNEKLSFPIKFNHIRTTSQEEEINELSKIDIGIFPTPLSLKETGNSGLGILKCMALAKPVIACDIGSAVDYISHGENGYLCRNTDDWYLALRSLLDEKEIGLSYGEDSRKKIESEFSIEKTYTELKKIFEL
jgi:glycosyltransferase involved in cell wall biosynthesis